MHSVVHFEICADQTERAVEFYRRVFGWQIEKENGAEEYWSINTGSDEEPAIVTGGLMKRDYPSDSTIVTIDVESVDDFARRITEAGGRIVAPKRTIPGLGYFQYCLDSEGNTFAILQFDESAE